MKSKDILKKRGLKVWCIILCIVTSYAMIHHVSDEVYFQRFSNIFIGFIEMYLNNHISLDYLYAMPLFSPSVQADPSVSSTAQDIMITESYFPNFVMLFLFLHYITGISPQTLVVLPLGVMFVPIIYLAMARTDIPQVAIHVPQFLLIAVLNIQKILFPYCSGTTYPISTWDVSHFTFRASFLKNATFNIFQMQ